MFLGGIDFKEFLSNHREWHALVEGFSEGFCLWTAHSEPSKELLEDLQKEHHYYVTGMVLGFATLMFTMVGAIILGVRAII